MLTPKQEFELKMQRKSMSSLEQRLVGMAKSLSSMEGTVSPLPAHADLRACTPARLDAHAPPRDPCPHACVPAGETSPIRLQVRACALRLPKVLPARLRQLRIHACTCVCARVRLHAHTGTPVRRHR